MSKTMKRTVQSVLGAALLSAGTLAQAQVSPGKQSHAHSKADQVCVSQNVSVSGRDVDVKVEEKDARCAQKVETLKSEELQDVARQATLQ